MNCGNPYINEHGQAFGCGQCLSCRINKRREWTHRIMLEAQVHADSCFLTLTYSDAFLPAGGNLRPGDLQSYLKRLRRSIEPARIRFYGVGEYGDETWRPHYHAAIFGLPACLYGYTRPNTHYVGKSCCECCSLFQRSWDFGAIYTGTLELSSAQYIAGYTVKKMTKGDDPRLQGLHPEFARMSNRPGIGKDALWEIASVLMQHNLDFTEVDVPHQLRHGPKLFPLGRYLQRNLREMIGKEPGIPQKANDEIQKKLLPLQHAAKSDAENPSFKAQILKANKGKRASIAAKEKLQRKKRL